MLEVVHKSVFYQCKNSAGSNQDWHFDTTGVFRSLYQSGNCLNTGSQILVYTNGDSVELIADGESLGVQTIAPYDAGVFLIQGTTTPKNLYAVAKKNGKAWGAQNVTQSSKPVSLVVEVDYPTNKAPIFSDAQDVALLRVYAVDQNGVLVRTALDVVTFTVVSGQGRIVGTGNGDPSDHMPDQGNKRGLWNGYARGIVGANLSSTAGTITVQVSSPGLMSAQVSISTVPRNGVMYL